MGLSGPYFLSLILKDLGLSGLEPPTSRLSGVRSNRLRDRKSVVVGKSVACVV